MQSLRLIFLLTLSAVPRRAFALPVSYTPAGTARTYIPLIVVSISLFLVVFVFLAVKLLYVEQRRLATVHAPHGTTATSTSPIGGHHLSSTTSFGSIRHKQENRYRPILVGFLGSPAWEANLASKLTRATWRRGCERRRRGYQMPTVRSTGSGSKSQNSTLGSRLTASSTLCCVDSVNQLPPAQWLTGGSSRIPSSIARGTHSGSAHRNASTPACIHSSYGDFGELDGVRSPRGASLPQPAGTRRASPSSIRLIDGPTLSNQVQYSFLSGLPPNAIVSSPLMGTRDSFQLSRCSLKGQRSPAPPLPSLPSFFPFRMPNGPINGLVQATEYLPSLRFSPLASVAKVFHSQQDALEERVPSVVDFGVTYSASASSFPKTALASEGGSSTSTWVVCETAPLCPKKTNVDRLQSCKGLAIAGSLSSTDFPALPWPSSKEERRGNVVCRSVSESSRIDSLVSKKPLKSCLRRNSVAPTTPSVGSPDVMLTPWMSEMTARTSTVGGKGSMGDRYSLWTPISDVDVGILGMDRFCWDEDAQELKVQPCHMKKDSVALVPVCE